MRLLYILAIILLTLSACNYTSPIENEIRCSRAKFEPDDGQCILFIGQDMGAIGGLKEYCEGYCDYMDTPAGITVYTNLSPGIESCGYLQKGNDGIFSLGNWGAGDCFADFQINHPRFKYCVLAIGLSIVDNERKIVLGELDSLIVELGMWIKELAPRPIFLRIGYEFDGDPWNHYSQNFYPKAWRYIVDLYTAMEIDNIAYVWQSKGNGTSANEMEEWYPGDRYVDWCGYSFFAEPDTEMLEFARKHNKPVFIAEAAPILMENNTYIRSDLSDTIISEKAWNNWFLELFNIITTNKDLVKALSYINVEWLSQEMWIDSPIFYQADSRIQESKFISEKWLEEITKKKYLAPSQKLWQDLWNKECSCR